MLRVAALANIAGFLPALAKSERSAIARLLAFGVAVGADRNAHKKGDGQMKRFSYRQSANRLYARIVAGNINKLAPRFFSGAGLHKRRITILRAVYPC